MWGHYVLCLVPQEIHSVFYTVWGHYVFMDSTTGNSFCFLRSVKTFCSLPSTTWNSANTKIWHFSMLRTGKITKTLALLVYFPYLDQGKTSPFYSFCFLQSVRALCSMCSTTGSALCEDIMYLWTVPREIHLVFCVVWRDYVLCQVPHEIQSIQICFFSAQCEDIMFYTQYHMKFRK